MEGRETDMEGSLQVIPPSTGAHKTLPVLWHSPCGPHSTASCFLPAFVKCKLLTCCQDSVSRTVTQYISPPVSTSVACKLQTQLIDFSSGPLLDSWVLEDCMSNRNHSWGRCPGYEQHCPTGREERGCGKIGRSMECLLCQTRHPQLAFCTQLPFVQPGSQLGAVACLKVLLHRLEGSPATSEGNWACCLLVLVKGGHAWLCPRAAALGNGPMQQSGSGRGEAPAAWHSRNTLRMKNRDCDCLSQDSALFHPLARWIRRCCQTLSDSSLFTTWSPCLFFIQGGCRSVLVELFQFHLHSVCHKCHQLYDMRMAPFS